MRRRARAGRPIVKRTIGLPSAPGMKPTRRDTQEPEDHSQRKTRARTIDGAQNPQLGFTLRQTLA
jgi:hypothetical protein